MKLRDDLILRHLGKDHVIVDPGQEMVDLSKVFTLNSTASFLWEALQGKEFNEELIISILLEHFEVDHGLAQQDAQKFMLELQAKGLLIT